MIKMKRTYLLVLILFLSVSLSAQKDKQAREILDKTANALQQAGGIRATFGGTSNKSGYNYKYTGIKSRNGKQGFEVILTPENKQDITSITLFVSQTYQPLYIKVEQSNKSANEIIVTSYQTNQPLDNATFKFDKKKFPNAEVIDLR